MPSSIESACINYHTNVLIIYFQYFSLHYFERIDSVERYLVSSVNKNQTELCHRMRNVQNN